MKNAGIVCEACGAPIGPLADKCAQCGEPSKFHKRATTATVLLVFAVIGSCAFLWNSAQKADTKSSAAPPEQAAAPPSPAAAQPAPTPSIEQVSASAFAALTQKQRLACRAEGVQAEFIATRRDEGKSKAEMRKAVRAAGGTQDTLDLVDLAYMQRETTPAQFGSMIESTCALLTEAEGTPTSP